MRVGVIGLGEAGNLGDDLILIACIASIRQAVPDAEVAHLSFGQTLPWATLEDLIPGSAATIEHRRPRRDWPLSRSAEKLFADCDYVLLGGGGLLQDTHHPWRPYHWLRYLPETRAPAIGVGLGAGPLSARWVRRLARMRSPLEFVAMRDPDSVGLVDQLGWPTRLSTDYVGSGFLHQMLEVPGGRTTPVEGLLGVSLRSWPGLTAEHVATHVEGIARRTGRSHLAFFVLEAKDGQGVDVEFTTDVCRLLGESPSQVHVYEPGRVREFVGSMGRCSAAVSMKLHASIVWSAQGVALFPILYAPKTAAAFGLRYQGLELLEEPVPLAGNPADAIPIESLAEEWLSKQARVALDLPRVRPRLGRGTRVRFQARSLATDLLRALRGRLRG